MNKKFNILIMLVIFVVIASSCRVQRETKEDDKDNVIKQEKKEVDKVMEKLNSMTLDEKIGQLVMIGIEGKDVNEHTKDMIQKNKIGGIILFKRNIRNLNQLIKLINSLKDTNLCNNIPMFIGVDEEGGRVTRLPREFLKSPSSEKIGNINDEEFSFSIGSIVGEKLKSAGFNLDFAPVLDINSNPNNPVIGDRSFGSSKEIVSKHGIQFMKGLKSKSVIPVVKHFPGHGDTSVDSHVNLPVITKELEQLKDFEFVPFLNCIQNGIDIVMVSHILLPEIDEHNPATFSKKIIIDILKKQMGFNGIVITDDMTMGAITKKYDLDRACVDSLKAGSDIVLVCHGYDNQVQVINAIKQAVQNKILEEDYINQKVYNILKIKQRYKLNNEKINNVNVEEINKEMKKILKQY